MKFLIFLGWTWRVIANLISLLVVFYIFSKLELETRFEFVVVSILGFIYLTIRAIAFSQARSLVQMGRGLSMQNSTG